MSSILIPNPTVRAVEETHADLERFHYQEVRTNPQYAAQGLTEVYIEEMAMNVPICDTTPLEDRISSLEEISTQPGKIPREYYRRLQELRGQVIFLQNKVNELVEGKQRVKKPGYQGLRVSDNES